MSEKRMSAVEFWKEVEPEPQIDPTLPYFNFNGVECPSFLRVKSVGISALPSLGVNLTTIAGKYGVLESGTTFGEKVITLDVMLVDRRKNMFQMASELAQFLKGDNWKLSKLTFNEIEGKHLMAKVKNSVSIDDLVVAGSGTIEFLIPTPLYISNEEKVVSAETKTINVDNKGTHEVMPVIKVTLQQSADYVEISNTTTGKKFKVTHSFRSGDVLEVDFSKKIIKINGKNSLNAFNIDSDWLELTHGNNSLLMSTNATTQVRFHELFI